MARKTAATSNTPLTLVRDNMDDIPEYGLPSGYRLRKYRPGDDRTWLDLHVAGEPFIEVTPDLFARQFGDGWDVLAERMFFVETDEGTAAASITAWWDKDRYGEDERGRIHWVIVHPDHRRLGIAKAMMTQAMLKLREHYRRSLLDTSSGRPFALKLYLDFGFYPDPKGWEQEETAVAWRRVQEVIRHAALEGYLAEHATH